MAIATDSDQASHPTTFKDKERFLQLLHHALDESWDPGLSLEDHVDQTVVRLQPLVRLLDTYQEIPTILDPALEAIVQPLMTYLDDQVGRFAQQWEQVHGSRKGKPTEDRDVWLPYVAACVPAFQVLYHLARVRGYKTLLKFFRHDVGDFEPVFCLLFVHPKEPAMLWMSRYVLLLWLSLLCMVPFDLESIDSGYGTYDYQMSLPELMLSLGKQCLSSTTRVGDGAALFLSRLVTRQDCADRYLIPYVQWACNQISTLEDVFLTNGILLSLAYIYKHGERHHTHSTVAYVVPVLTDLYQHPTVQTKALTRKLVTKLIQRVGLCCLRPQAAPWRYQMGLRSLSENLTLANQTHSNVTANFSVATTAAHGMVSCYHDAEDDYDENVVEQDSLEETIELLLGALKDRDTIVRWSAAKGLGRITFRLPLSLARDIIQCILDLFVEDTGRESHIPLSLEEVNSLDIRGVSEWTWHGACLALAELVRKGLLLPNSLTTCLPWVIKALKFDLKRGSHSVGSNVRDAACYVLWSLARAYPVLVLQEYTNTLSQSLITVALFDREIHVRRAASAAFQEHVGRLGLFPHGIAIMTQADYFSLSQIRHAYLTVAVEVARHREYAPSLLTHLSTLSTHHWDQRVRELAAEALYELVPFAPDVILDTLLPSMLRDAVGSDLGSRHGNLLAIGAVCRALVDCPSVTAGESLKDQVVIQDILTLPARMPSRYLSDFGADLTYAALCDYMGQVLLANWPPVNSDVGKQWYQLALGCLSRSQDIHHRKASEVLYWYYQRFPPTPVELAQDQSYFFGQLSSNQPVDTRCGHCLAIASLPLPTNQRELQRFDQFLDPLVDILIPSTTDLRTTIELKVNALTVLYQLCSQWVRTPGTVLSAQGCQRLLTGLRAALDDYTTDKRGDIGSLVRQAGARVVRVAFPVVFRGEPFGQLESELHSLKHTIIGSLLRLTLEKLDRLRVIAGTVLAKLVHGELSAEPTTADSTNRVSHKAYPVYYALEPLYSTQYQDNLAITHPDYALEGQAQLRTVLPLDGPDGLRYWESPAIVFAGFAPLMNIPIYRPNLTLGLFTSAGCLTESLRKVATVTLLDTLRALPSADSNTSSTLGRAQVIQTVVKLLEHYQGNDRVVQPCLQTLAIMVESLLVQDLSDTVLLPLVIQIRRELFRTKDIKRLTLAIRIYAGLLYGPETLFTKSLGYLLGLLGHPFPTIRQLAADYLYTNLCVANPTLDGKLLDVERLLVHTAWTRPLAETKTTRHRLYDILGVPLPTVVRKPPSEQ
ncbi:hypothetical protein IWQ62_001210 [Dispira parvispora]|uniref:Tubulin-specific chaperone D n=1 Tax=Dispira parvispora TaxID=1520584 RepID=A0A9W8AWM9_9FUNG|nr:hypothetical protein IWQ62_001210 [Dispira parvispora]